MKTRDDGMEITNEDAEAIESGVDKIERDPNRPRTVWVDFNDGSSTSGILYDNGTMGWVRPEMIEAETLRRALALFEEDA